MNLNSLEIIHDHFSSMSSPNFRLSGGSLGYWTACNNLKRYRTLPYCDVWYTRPVYCVLNCITRLQNNQNSATCICVYRTPLWHLYFCSVFALICCCVLHNMLKFYSNYQVAQYWWFLWKSESSCIIFHQWLWMNVFCVPGYLVLLLLEFLHISFQWYWWGYSIYDCCQRYVINLSKCFILIVR